MTDKQYKKKIELLAPAGSYETFLAVIRAGADAVYLGGSQFGARAYANNFGETELLSAIDYAHIHGRQVYLTVNTLFKEKELEEELYRYLLPYYKQGLDAVIVQDMGAFSLIRREFPDLEIHTSTQMTVTGRYGAAYMKELGASRVVTAREMSFAEIRDIHENVDVEIESFVHGALCYCYSGQCLLSSMLGGRSGNRGRCAQPCRLPYEVYDENLKQISGSGNYILSPKDLCTIQAIPQLVESGVYSFKIEGRMKQAEYAAGVVSIYRSYIDRYLKELQRQKANGKDEQEAYLAARKSYRVAKEDMQKLLDFGNRSGFTDGYYFRQNGKEMITFQSPGHAKTNEALQSEIREKYVLSSAPGAEIKEKINGILKLNQDFPAIIELNDGDIHIEYEGDIVQPALKQPLSREKVESCMRKTGNTPFEFEHLDIEMDSAVFLPVQSLNQLRREALMRLEEQLAAGWRRNLPAETQQAPEMHGREADREDSLSAMMRKENVSGIYAESDRKASRNLQLGERKENLAVSVERQDQIAPVLA
ncbi:MAG: U32 family peptidase, partial [Roseburia sp.]|nr:U32 family peptidase [Roseburia sp.]